MAARSAHLSWAATDDRSARTAPARAAMRDRFLREAEGDPLKAESLRKAFYCKLAAQGVAARRKR